MKLAITGKGGSGKTTLSATLSRILSRRGRSVLVIDGDPNPNLGRALGISDEQAAEPVPRDVVKRVESEPGKARLVLAYPVSEIIGRYGVQGPDGVKLLVGSRVDHPGAG